MVEDAESVPPGTSLGDAATVVSQGADSSAALRRFFPGGISSLAFITRACRSSIALSTVSLSAEELLSCSIQSRC
jgi:hypothetical protein